MKFGIPPWIAEGYKQIGTNWFVYDAPTDGNKVLNEISDRANGKDLYQIDVPLVIPQGEAYFFGIERVLLTVDADGNAILIEQRDADGNVVVDAEGNPVMVEDITIKVPINRTKRTEDALVNSANIFPNPKPLQPILKEERLDSGDIRVSSSTILPESLNLEKITWVVYGDDVLLYSIETSVDHVYDIVIPTTYIESSNIITVIAIQRTVEGVSSPFGRIDIDSNKRIKVLSDLTSVNAHVDYYFSFEPVLATENFSKSLVRVELIETISDRVVKTYYPTDTNTIIIESELIKPESGYAMVFTLRSRYEDSSFDTTIIRFQTKPEYTLFYTDEEFKYQNRYRMVAAPSCKNIGGLYIEKRDDGRFLGTDKTDVIGWFTMDNGLSTTPLELNFVNPFTGPIVSINLHRKFMLLAGTNKTTGKKNILFVKDDLPAKSIIIVETFEIEGLDLRSLVFNHSERKVYFNDLLEVKIKTITIDKNDSGVRVIESISPRPDTVIVNNAMAYIGDDTMLMLGGRTDNTYYYNIKTKTYGFVSVLPQEFIDVKLQTVRRIDGNFVFFPINSAIRKILVFHVNGATFSVEEPSTFLPNGDNIIKSSGVILKHNAEDVVAYYD